MISRRRKGYQKPGPDVRGCGFSCTPGLIEITIVNIHGRLRMSDPPPLSRAIADQFKNVQTTLCLSTKVVVITEDQLELRVQDGMQKLSARSAWIAPAGILVTCLGTLCTADFKDFAFVSRGTLKGVFVALTVASVVWLAISFRRISAFGRREFMESIRKAGAQYNVAAGETPSGLQCRLCGSILPSFSPGQVARCPACGAVN